MSRGLLASISDVKALPGSRSGKCGNVCPTDPNAIVSCLNGRCSFACTGSYTQCINANGAQFCADLQQDNNNCGALPSTASCAGAGECACQRHSRVNLGSVACAGLFAGMQRHLRSPAA